VGIIQSNYLPWRGYFDFIASVDLFIVLDDVQYSTGAWRNRNRIKTPAGPQWITVPVRHRLGTLVQDTAIDYRRDWMRDHRRSIAQNYARAPFTEDALAMLEAAYAAAPATISELNVDLLRRVCGYLEIGTPLRLSAEFPSTGTKTERLIGLLSAAGATTYVSGPNARAYLDEAQFTSAGIRLEYKAYDYRPYPQLWGPYDGAVSVIDLIANCGPGARRLLRSETENSRAA
jgi:hypothetical protein